MMQQIAVLLLLAGIIYGKPSGKPSLKIMYDVYAPDLHNTNRTVLPQYYPSQFSSQRSGNPTDGHSCDTVLNYVPSHLTFITRYNHYRKYTHAYDIPIVSSAYVSDAALKRACYVVRFLLADRKTIRHHLYKYFGRIGIMGTREGTTSIPEHRHLGAWWDTRARGLGGTLAIPISTGAEENLMCSSTDRYRKEDIFLHEFSHGIQEIAITAGGIRGYNSRLQRAYNSARSRRLWANTYAMSTWKEYFSEGVQSYFNVNSYSATPDGVHNHVNTRAKLRSYDYTLYNLVKEVFPCGNLIVDRCDRSGVKRTFRMDCDRPPTTKTTPMPKPSPATGGVTKRPTSRPSSPEPTDCKDDNTFCSSWAKKGECTRNPTYMKVSCRKSCSVCCSDSNTKCSSWAAKGECTANPNYMKLYCKNSCNVC